MKKGFTLIEIIIVIAVTAILLGISMNFGGMRIKQLRFNSAKNNFINAYERIYSDNITSNYFMGKKFNQLIIYIESGSNNISYKYEPAFRQISELIDDDISINKLVLNSEFLEKVQLVYTPYNIGCSIQGQMNNNNATYTGDTLSLQMSSNYYNKIYCFKIQSDNCILQEMNCENN